jgi:ribosomal protein S18 acetylase RimI-like enzyme
MKPPARPQQGIAQFRRPALQRQVGITTAPNYHVQPPMNLAGRQQQIRATVGGTPQVAGSVELSARGGGKAFVSNLQVDQQHRRRGVAAKLIEAAVTTARRQGFRTVTLEARPSDNGISPQALVAMYRRQGFQSVGKTSRGSPLMERKL